MKKLYLAGLFSLLVGCGSVSESNFLGFNERLSLTDAVSIAFMNNEQLVGLPIQIETAHGKVRLTGYVKTIKQSDVAGDVASKVKGVKAVENYLIVRK